MNNIATEVTLLKKQVIQERQKYKQLENELFFLKNSLTGRVAIFLRILCESLPGFIFLLKILRYILLLPENTNAWLTRHYPIDDITFEKTLTFTENYNIILIDFDQNVATKVNLYFKKVQNIRQCNYMNTTDEIQPGELGDFIQQYPYTLVLSRNALPLPTLISFFSLALEQHPNAKIIYCDGDIQTKEGKRASPFFKPAWSPDLFLGFDYISQCFLIKTELLFDKNSKLAFSDSRSLYSFLLSILLEKSINNNDICHIPMILYELDGSSGSLAFHGLDTKIQYALVSDFFKKNNIQAEIKKYNNINGLDIQPTPVTNPLISIIIPTKDKLKMLSRCVDAILNRTNYTNIEVIIIDNQSTDIATLSYLDSLQKEEKVRVFKYEKAFNYAEINNYGARKASGQYYLLLNNDIDVINPMWLDYMLGYAQLSSVGCVGAYLYYPDGSLQHGGVIGGVGGIAGHSYRKSFPKSPDPSFCRDFVRDVIAVTGACLLVKKDIFDEAGGMDERFRVAYNDIDLCLKIYSLGYRNVINPQAKLIHYESISRGTNDTLAKRVLYNYEKSLMIKKWGKLLAHDPYYNPNYSLLSENFQLATRIDHDLDALVRTA